MKTVAIIQARLCSTRLPSKVLLDLGGEPMLTRVIARVRRAPGVDAVVVATTTAPADDALVDFCASRGWPCFRGSENDVLDRYWQTARAHAADVVVRITADCPLIDPEVTGEVIREFQVRQPDCDYAGNFHPQRTFPRGLDTEVFGIKTLERCWHEAQDTWSREHVTAFIYAHPELFRIHGMASEVDYSAHRWTVDTPEDLALARCFYAHFGHDHFTWHDALLAVERHPEWTAMNAHVQQKVQQKMPQ